MEMNSVTMLAAPEPLLNPIPEIGSRILRLANARFMSAGAAFFEQILAFPWLEKEHKIHVIFNLITKDQEINNTQLIEEAPSISDLIKQIEKLSLKETDCLWNFHLKSMLSEDPENDLSVAKRELDRLRSVAIEIYNLTMPMQIYLNKHKPFYININPLLFENIMLPAETKPFLQKYLALEADLKTPKLRCREKQKELSSVLCKGGALLLDAYRCPPDHHPTRLLARVPQEGDLTKEESARIGNIVSLFSSVGASEADGNIPEITAFFRMMRSEIHHFQPPLEPTTSLEDIIIAINTICDPSKAAYTSVRKIQRNRFLFQYLPLYLILEPSRFKIIFNKRANLKTASRYTELLKEELLLLCKKYDLLTHDYHSEFKPKEQNLEVSYALLQEEINEAIGPLLPESERESLQDSLETESLELTRALLCKKKLAAARELLNKANINNEPFHGKTLRFFIAAERIARSWWSWLHLSINRTKTVISISEKLQNQLCQEIKEELAVECPSSPIPESPPVTALPLTLNIDTLHRLSLKVLNNKTSLLHVCIAYQAISHRQDIPEALIALHLAFENLLPSADHCMTEVLRYRDHTQEQATIVSDLNKLEIFSRNPSRHPIKGEARTLFLRGLNPVEPEEPLIADFHAYFQKAVFCYLDLLGAEPDLTNQMTLLISSLPVFEITKSALSEELHALFSRMLSSVTARDGAAPISCLIYRLQSILSKDMGRMGYSYQVTSSLHLIGVIVEEWLFMNHKDADRVAIGHDLSPLLVHYPDMEPELYLWAKKTYGISVGSRYDSKTKPGELAATIREVARKDSPSRGIKPHGDEGKVMSRDLTLATADLSSHLEKLARFLEAT